MMRRGLALLPLGLLLLAVAEIAVFVAMVHAIGAGWTLLIIAGSSVAGLALLRREGIRGWRAFRAAAEAGRPPGPHLRGHPPAPRAPGRLAGETHLHPGCGPRAPAEQAHDERGAGPHLGRAGLE